MMILRLLVLSFSVADGVCNQIAARAVTDV
jgi:hypothetical protein